MKALSSNVLLIDSGFWFAFFNETGNYHLNALAYEDYLKKYQLAIPWPSLYETLNTKLVKNKNSIINFEKVLSQSNVHFIEDHEFRKDAYNNTLKLSTSGKRPISFVDMIIRSILEDVNFRVNYLLTFNPGDFYDICLKRKIELIN